MAPLIKGCTGSALSMFFGFVIAMIAGLFFWRFGGALLIMGIGLVLAGSFSRLFVTKFNWPASVISASSGAIVAGFVAGTTLEFLPPGSFEWLIKGGLCGAAIGVPISVLLGPLGLIEHHVIAIGG